MRCPSCYSLLPSAVPECPACKLTIDRLDARFGALPRHMQFFTDRSDSMPLRGMKDIRALLGLFHRQFPQALFSAFVIPEVKKGTIAEYTFWLANRGRFSPEDVQGADNFDLLLGVDLGARAATLMVGYGMEHYLTEQDLTDALTSGANAFRANDIIGGVRSCVEFVMARMRDVALRIEQENKRRIGQTATETEAEL